MAFVKEKIETEEQKKRYLSFDFRDCLGDPIKIGKYSTWYVDKENFLYFDGMGGGSFEIPEMYALMTKQGCIVIQSDIDKLNVVGKISYSKSVHLPDETILQYVHEALKAQDTRSFKNNEISLLPKPEPMDDFEETHYGIRKNERTLQQEKKAKPKQEKEPFSRMFLRAFLIALFMAAITILFMYCNLFK